MNQNKIWILVTVLSGLIDYSYFSSNSNKLQCLKAMNPMSSLQEFTCFHKSLSRDSSIIEYPQGSRFVAKILTLDKMDQYGLKQIMENTCEYDFPNKRIITTSNLEEKKYFNELNDTCDDIKCWKFIELSKSQILLVASDSQLFLKLLQSTEFIEGRFLAIVELITLLSLFIRVNQNDIHPPIIVFILSLFARILVENQNSQILVVALLNFISKAWLKYYVLNLAKDHKFLKQSRYHSYAFPLCLFIDFNNMLVMLDQLIEGYPIDYKNPIDRLDLFSNSFIFVMILHLRLNQNIISAKIQMYLSLRKIFLILSLASNRVLLDIPRGESLFWIAFLVEQAKQKSEIDIKKHQNYPLISDNETELSEMSEVNQLL